MSYQRTGTVVVLALIAAPLLAGEQYTKTIKVGDTPDIVISNTSGEVIVVGERTSTVTVKAELGSYVERLDVIEKGDLLKIEVIHKRSGNKNKEKYKGGSGAADLYVSVPYRANVEVNAVSADIDVEEVKGELVLNAVSGDIEAETYGGLFKAISTSGDIDLVGASAPGKLYVQSVSGDIDIVKVAGGLKVSAVSGDITVADSNLSDLRMGTTSGNMDVMSSLTADVDLDAESVSGEIEIELKKGFGGRIDVKTLSGDIDNCFGPKPEKASRYGPGKLLVFDHANGSGRLDMETVNGDVTICFE